MAGSKAMAPTGPFMAAAFFRRFAALLAFSCALFPASPSYSHDSIGSVSNVIATVRGSRLDYFLNVPSIMRVAMEQVGLIEEKRITQYITSRLHVSTSSHECQIISFDAPAPQPSGNFIIHLVFDCHEPINDLRLSSALFYDIDQKHIQFFRLAGYSNPREPISETILTQSNHLFKTSDVRSSVFSIFSKVYSYFQLGVQHILGGYDHILFLLCVILFAPSLIETIKIVTSFTVAHSVTLGLAYMGVISLSTNIVEPLIALTIVYVAFENYFSKSIPGKRWLLVLFFGLIHGLGFVDVLKGVTVSKNELLLALFSFNAGIEAGQVIIVVFFFAILTYLRRYSWTPVFLRWSSVTMGLTGMIWFLQRTIGYL
ncbi:MAG TPA: HupE/UreJ family protein [Nitrospirae bacterium]|nr:HupE/UreJ family protein [Nitrospirota bacterium]